MAKQMHVFLALIVGGLLVVGGLYAAGKGPFSTADAIPPATAVAQTDVGVAEVQCQSTTQPAVTIRTFDAYNVGTAVNEASVNVYREKGTNTWTVFSPGSSFTAAFGKNYEVLVGANTTDATDNNYGPHFETGAIPCQPTVTIEKAVYNDDPQDGTFAGTFYNADGDAAYEGFVAGQTQTVSLKFSSGTDKDFGNPYIASQESGTGGQGQRAAYPNVLCLNLNTTAWDQPEKVSFKGVEMKRVSTPQRHAAVANKIAYCYEAPVVSEGTMDTDRIQLRLNADDANAPANDDIAYMYASTYFIDSDTGAVVWGVEDTEGNAVAIDAAEQVTLDFTA